MFKAHTVAPASKQLGWNFVVIYLLLLVVLTNNTTSTNTTTLGTSYAVQGEYYLTYLIYSRLVLLLIIEYYY